MKHNCNGCKALRLEKGEFYCSLGYKVAQFGKERGFDIPVTAKPLENCPKPKTNKAYREILENY